MTAYQAFFKHHFNDMRDKARAEAAATAEPGAKFKPPVNKIVSKIGEMWRAMDGAETAAFAERVVRPLPAPAPVRATSDSLGLQGALPPARSGRRGGKRKRSGPKPKRTGPKQPMTAYQLFFRENEGKLSGKVSPQHLHAIFVWSRHERRRLCRQTPGYERAPDMTQTVIVRTIGERWRSLDEAGKAEYKRRQEADKLRYEQELLTWSGDDLELQGADSATALDHSKALKNEEREEKKRKREAEKVGIFFPARSAAQSLVQERCCPWRQAVKAKEREAKALARLAARPVKRAKSAFSFFSAAVGAKLKEENPDAPSAAITKLKNKQWKQMPDEEKRPYVEAEAADEQRYAAEVAAKEATRQQAAEAEQAAEAAAEAAAPASAAAAAPQPPADPTCSDST